MIRFLLLLISMTSFAFADNFEVEAKKLASDLKILLMKNLSEKIANEGIIAAIPFCHQNVKPIAKLAAKERLNKFEFGRTSHKIRNAQNAPQPWAESYLKDFQGSFQKDGKQSLVHKLENGKRIYLEPLYVQVQCLNCHGQTVSADIKEKLSALYPQDQAMGFKLGQFRGFIWVKEK
jgi:hypothetical protein